MYDNNKRFKIPIIKVSEGEKKESGAEKVYEEIMAKPPKLGKRHKPTDPRNLVNTHRINTEKSAQNT